MKKEIEERVGKLEKCLKDKDHRITELEKRINVRKKTLLSVCSCVFLIPVILIFVTLPDLDVFHTCPDIIQFYAVIGMCSIVVLTLVLFLSFNCKIWIGKWWD